MQGIIRMITRMAIRNAVNIGVKLGIDKGVDHMTKRGHGGAPLTKAQRRQAGESKKRMRQTMRMIRRIGRF